MGSTEVNTSGGATGGSAPLDGRSRRGTYIAQSSMSLVDRGRVVEVERIDPAALPRRPIYHAAKRAFDVAFSAFVLAAMFPVLAATAVAIKLDSPGPAIFVQERMGKDGKVFPMYKFRSMVADAEKHLDELRDLNEKDGPVFKIADDPRVTRVGRLIRKTSIDELPQFVNVLLGQMSVVGPRPALPREVAQYTEYQCQRLLVKPGITCYWQTRRNRDFITFDEWVDLDLLYIQKCSVWTDFKLIVQTVGVVLTAQGS